MRASKFDKPLLRYAITAGQDPLLCYQCRRDSSLAPLQIFFGRHPVKLLDVLRLGNYIQVGLTVEPANLRRLERVYVIDIVNNSRLRRQPFGLFVNSTIFSRLAHFGVACRFDASLRMPFSLARARFSLSHCAMYSARDSAFSSRHTLNSWLRFSLFCA